MCNYKQIDFICPNADCRHQWYTYETTALCPTIRQEKLDEGVPEFEFSEPTALQHLQMRPDECRYTSKEPLEIVQEDCVYCRTCRERESEKLPAFQPLCESPETMRRSGRRDTSDPVNWKSS